MAMQFANTKTMKNMKVFFQMAKKTGMEFVSIQMVINIMEIGKKICEMEKELYLKKMAKFMKEIGKMIKNLDLGEFI